MLKNTVGTRSLSHNLHPTNEFDSVVGRSDSSTRGVRIVFLIMFRLEAKRKIFQFVLHLEQNWYVLQETYMANTRNNYFHPFSVGEVKI